MLISIEKRRSTIDQYSPSQRLEASKSQEPTTVFTPWQQETHQQYASSQFRNFLDSKLKHPDFANREWAIQGSCSSIPDIESYTQNLMSPSDQKMDSGRIEGPSARRHTAEKLRIKNRSSFLSPKKRTSTLETYSNELSSLPNTPQSNSKKSNSKALGILVNSKNNEFWNRYNKKLDSNFAALATKQKTEMDLVSTKNSINKDKTLAKFLKKRISIQSHETGVLQKPKNSTNLKCRKSSPEKQEDKVLDDSSESSDELPSSSRASNYEEFEGSKLQEDYRQRKDRVSNPVEVFKNYEVLLNKRKSEQVMTVSKIVWPGQMTSKQSRVTTSPDHLNDTAQRLTSIERLKSLAYEGNSLLAVRGTAPVNFNYNLVRASAPNVMRPSTRHLISETEGKNDSVILNSISMTNKIWSQHINQYEVSQIPLLQNLKPGLQGFKKKTENTEQPKRKALQLTLSSKTRPQLSRNSQVISLQNSGASSPKEAQQNTKISSPFANVSQFFHLNKEFRTISKANNSQHYSSLNISRSTMKDEFIHFTVQTEEGPQAQKVYKVPSKPRTQATLESFRTSSQRKITPKDLNPNPKSLGRFIKRR